jgi:hypothetical protein
MTKHISLIKAAHLFVFALVLARLVALWNDVSAPLRIVTAGLVVTVVAVRRAPCAVRRAPCAVRLAPRPHWVQYAAAGLGLLVVPVFAMLGIDYQHDGTTAWSGNEDADCAGTCIAMLPTRSGGTEPAGWNAWRGGWGRAICVKARERLVRARASSTARARS